MPTDPEKYLGCLAIGLSVALVVYCGKEHLARALDAVQRDLTDKLRRLHLPAQRLRTHLLVWVGATAVAFVALGLGAGSWIFAVLAAVLLLGTPWYVLRRMAQRRKQKIEDQLADAMVALASAVRAGLSLAQALEILATQCPWPIRAEFRQIVGEYTMGKPMERTLVEAKQRLASENFALFAAAMLASHESGGRLNETVERIAASVLELQRLERKVLSETAQARRSALYMAIAPVFVLAAYYYVDPLNTTLLFTHVVGQCVLAIAVVLDVAAYVWARLILNPDM